MSSREQYNAAQDTQYIPPTPGRSRRSPMPDELETRYYIALMDRMKGTAKIGPGRPDQFNIGPTEPFIDENNVAFYPVSREIAEEWTPGEEDKAPDA